MYKQDKYVPATRNMFSYWNRHDKGKYSGERVHRTTMDAGIDEEGNKNYHNFMMDKKTGLLGGSLAAYMQVRLNKTVVEFYNSFNCQYPKNKQDVCDVIRSATFDQVLKIRPGQALTSIYRTQVFPTHHMFSMTRHDTAHIRK